MGETGSGQDELDRLLAFWGKARPLPEARASWHPCLYHELDVAAVGERLLGARTAWAERIAAEFGRRTGDLAALAVFLLSLHDIGKLSLPFQGLVPELWPEAVLGPRLESVPPRPGIPKPVIGCCSNCSPARGNPLAAAGAMPWSRRRSPPLPAITDVLPGNWTSPPLPRSVPAA